LFKTIKEKKGRVRLDFVIDYKKAHDFKKLCTDKLFIINTAIFHKKYEF